MADVYVTSVYGYKSIEDFLTENRHFLVRRISAIQFLDWLRSKRVFSPQDQEDVEFNYQTPTEKNGRLLDLIQKKGERGFKAFMQVIEYDYPDIFESLTNERPGKPPLEYNPSISIRRKSISVGVIRFLSDLLKSIPAEDRTATRKIIDDLEQENEVLKNWADEMEEKCSRLRREKFEWMIKQEAMADEREELRTESVRQRKHIAEVTTERDEAMAEGRELRRQLDELKVKIQEEHNHLEREKRRSQLLQSSMHNLPSDAEIAKLRQENRNLTEKLRASRTVDLDATEEKTVEADVDRLKEELKTLTDSNEQLGQELHSVRTDYANLTDEKEKIAAELGSLRDQLSALCDSEGQTQKRCEDYVKELQLAQNDRNKAFKDRSSLQEKCVDHLKKLDEYAGQTVSLYSRIQDLEKERAALLLEKDTLSKNMERLLGSSAPPAGGDSRPSMLRSTSRFAVLIDESNPDYYIYRYSSAATSES